MKLIDLVKRIEAAGLQTTLYVDPDGTLMLRGETMPRLIDYYPVPHLLFICQIHGDSTSPYRPDVDIITELAKAAEHPEAVYRREVMERIDPATDAAMFANIKAEKAAANAAA